MISNFAKAVMIADEENYMYTVTGSERLLEIMEHLAGGGTVNNMEDAPAGEIVAMLAMAWRDVRDLAALKLSDEE